ncbi:M23 family metallopeptidase [bacterium]|nr:M23 family metallopeptidase [bacterium]
MRRRHFTFVAAIFLALATLSFVALQGGPSGAAPESSLSDLSDTLHAADSTFTIYDSRTGQLTWGDNLASKLLDMGATRDEVNAVTGVARHLVDLDRIQVGTRLHLELDRRGLARLVIQEPSKLESVALYRTGPMLFVAQVERPQLDTLLVRYEGTIQNSFYQTCIDNGGSVELAAIFYSVFRDVFYFNSETRIGDRYRMIVEEIQHEGRAVGYGRVMVAEYLGQRGEFTAVWGPLEGTHSGGDFFDVEGFSYRRALMQIPFEDRVAVRVTSNYGNRYHPISGKWRKHNGMDLAAPMGTPILAAGDGVITKVARNHPGYGNWIQIRHPNGYETRYGHMRRFASGMRVGLRVKQGQKIGEVGMTGYATGPHLHYEVFSNGRRVNPKSIKTSPVKKLDDTQLASFIEEWYEPWTKTMNRPGSIPSDKFYGPPLPLPGSVVVQADEEGLESLQS